MAQFKNLVIDGDARIVGNLYDNNPSIAYATCSTAAATATKVVTTSNGNWNLKTGSIIIINSSYTNTATGPTLNVDNTGAKSIWYDSNTITTTNLDKAGTVNKPSMYMYNGTYYVWMGWSSDSTYSGTLATVATTGNYSDLLNKPNATLTIQKNGTTVGTFSNTSTGDITVNITVPTDTGDLTNNSGYMLRNTYTESNVVTRTSYSTLNSSSIKWQGYVCQLTLTITTDTTYSDTDYLFVGALTESDFAPAYTAVGFGFTSNNNNGAAITGTITSGGDIGIRVDSGIVPASTTVTISFLYLAN